MHEIENFKCTNLSRLAQQTYLSRLLSQSSSLKLHFSVEAQDFLCGEVAVIIYTHVLLRLDSMSLLTLRVCVHYQGDMRFQKS